MKLWEALKELEEGRCDWIYSEYAGDIIRYVIYDDKITMHVQNKITKEWDAPNHATYKRTNWQLHKEPKFKVGDLVYFLYQPKTIKSPYFQEILKVVENENRHSYMLEPFGFPISEEKLTLIMPAEELAETLGEKHEE